MNNQCSYCAKKGLPLLDGMTCIFPDNIVVLGRFSSTRWIVKYGWYSYEGNRKICGWYLIQENNPKVIKSIQETDLDDIYVVEIY